MQTTEQKTGKRQTHGQKYKKKLQDWQIGLTEIRRTDAKKGKHIYL